MARGLTQERLAECDTGFQPVYSLRTLGHRLEACVTLHPRTVQKIEAGDITILVTTLLRLRAAIGCDWRRLLG